MLSFLQNFATWFALIEIVLAVVMIVLVLLQAKGSDMSALLGGDSSSSFRTKRGLEVVIHRWTIYLSIVFFVVTILTFISMGQAV